VAEEERVGWRVQAAVYGCGTLNHSLGLMVTVIMPLWALALGASPLIIGIALGARHLLPMLLSIHGGALMDRLGTRRVMLWFSLVTACSPLLFPALPWVWALIPLQLIAGLSETMGWTGAQTLIGQVMRSNPLYAGRLSFCVRLGHFCGPPLVGLCWDLLGPWGAFGLLSLWGAAAYLAAWFLPAPPPSDVTQTEPVRPRDLLPRLSDYVEAFRLLAFPAVLFVMLITAVRHSGSAMQSSFYVVYLEGIGITGTQIGLLITASAVVGAVGALVTGRLSQRFEPVYLLVVTVIGAVSFIAITPLLGSYILLIAAMGLRGGTLGISQPLMISILGRSLPPGTQGKGVGLRTTANRVTQTFLPPVAGAVVEVAGLEASFYVVGGVAVALLLMFWALARRHDAFRNAQPESPPPGSRPA
jgi:MFS family permease